MILDKTGGKTMEGFVFHHSHQIRSTISLGRRRKQRLSKYVSSNKAFKISSLFLHAQEHFFFPQFPQKE